MPVYLCPIHDVRFNTRLDHDLPHHAKGHSECPLCQRDAAEKIGAAAAAPGTKRFVASAA